MKMQPTIHAQRARAFTLTEVMFATVILGLGFIFVAALLASLVTQSRSTVDESVAAAVARAQFAMLQKSMTDANTPVTGGAMRSMDNEADLWAAVSGQLIQAGDPRYACVAMYQRDAGALFAKVMLIVTRVQNRSTYDPAADLNIDPNDVSGTPPTLGAKRVEMMLSVPRNDEPFLEFDPADPNSGAVAPGAYVVLIGPGATGDIAGRTYRVGNVKSAARGQWFIAPPFAPTNPSEAINAPTTAMVVGRGYSDPRQPAAGFDGSAQDVSTYVSFVALR